jgi:hypothetical protein
MGIFKKNNTLELQDRIDELVEENTNLNKQCQSYQKTISSFMGVKASYDEAQKKLVESHISEVNLLKQEIELEKKSVARKVNTELASIGVSTENFLPEEISTTPKTLSNKVIWEQWHDMPAGPEKHKVFKEYQKEIDAHVKSLSEQQ